MQNLRWLLGLGLVVLASGLVSCSDPMDASGFTTSAMELAKVAGDEQTGEVDSPLSDPVRVQVLDANHVGVAGVRVEWKVSEDGGAVVPVTGTTDAAGYASADWTLGSVEGGYLLTAEVSGVGSVRFSANGKGKSDQIVRVTVDPSTLTLDSAGARGTLSATAWGKNGKPVEGATFHWSSLTPEVAVVDSVGRVTARTAGAALVVALTATLADTANVTVADTTTPPDTTTTPPDTTTTPPDTTTTPPDTTTAPDTAAHYVATTGSDAAEGTASAPWRTIAHALTQLAPGETLYVRGGEYREDIQNPSIRVGRPDARIRVKAYPGERPVLRGLLWLDRPSYWTIDGLNVTWAPEHGPTDHMVKLTNGVGWVFENGELWGARSFSGLLVYGSIAGEPADWTIRGNCIHDIWTDPLHHVNGDHNLYINTGITAGAGLIERNILFNAPNGQNIKLGYGRSDPQPGDGTANVTVRNNTMYGALKNLMLTDESHDNVIERNIIVGSDEGYALRAYRLAGSGNVIRDNVLSEMRYLQYGDSGYGLATDGGGNLLPHDPRFDSVGCSGFRPADETAQAYGRYAP